MTTVEREAIEFQPLRTDIRVFVARLVGVSPLLMHNPRFLMPKEEKGASRKEIVNAKDEADLGVYRLDDYDPTSPLAIPADNVRQAMLTGSKGLRYHRKAVRPILTGALTILVPRFVLTRNGEPILQYDAVDARRVVVKGNGIMRGRPLVDRPWELEIRFQLDVATAQPGIVMQALVEAGSRIGLLEYRPERGGTFGRFEVVEGWIEPL
jgi:hypothetical protein